jgi:hypothetical protein
VIGPREPAANLRQLASVLHQTYTALVAEGFTEQQALTIIGMILAAQTGGQPGGAT